MSNDELCPSCGKFVSSLREDTGFCANCSKPYKLSVYDKAEQFLANNADHIEHYLSTGISFSAAIEKLRADTKPRCACCGVLIKRAARTAVFCRDKPQCRKASRRYVYYYNERGMTKANALAKVLSDLNGS